MREMKIILGENQRVDAHYKGQVIKTDQPRSQGGDESEPSPFDLFLASIGTCAGYYVKSFCRQRGIDDRQIELVQRMYVDKESRMITTIEIDIFLPPGFPDKYKESVVKASKACAVKKHIAQAPEFIVQLVD